MNPCVIPWMGMVRNQGEEAVLSVRGKQEGVELCPGMDNE